MLDGMPFPFREDDIDSEHPVIWGLINAAFDGDAVRQFNENLILAVRSLAGEAIPVNGAAIRQPL